MRTPIVLLTGVSADAMATTMVGLQFDLPHAVAVRHRIDVDEQILERVVSDVTGVIEREETMLGHACVSCALREDIIPTLDRLAGDGRWATVIAHLPVGAEATQVCNVVAWDTRLARRLRIASVVTALAGGTLVEDLLGDALLVERQLQTAYDDTRGVGEVAASMVEYADVVVVTDAADPSGVELVRTLARPGAHVISGAEMVDAALVSSNLHHHSVTNTWATPVFSEALEPVPSPHVWRVDLHSPRAFHPARLLEGLESLGGGRHRSRGCFWLPTRPGQVLVWDGAGGQLSIGNGETWGKRAARTRLVLTGIGSAPRYLDDAFAEMLLTPPEAGARSTLWRVAEDGFEPWLGPVREVA